MQGPTKLTFKGINAQAKTSPEITVTPEKEEWILGRDDPKQKPDVDLGKDSGCSRKQGTIVYKADKFTFKQSGSTAVAGYVLTAGKKYQILDNFIFDFGGKQKALFTFSDVLPASQVKDASQVVQSPLFILEGRTEGLQRGKDNQVTLKVLRLTKKGEEPVNFEAKQAVKSNDKDSAQVWDFDQGEANSTFSVEFKGKFRLGYQPQQNFEGKAIKAFWYLEVITEDPDFPIVLYFLNKDQLKSSKESDDFIFENSNRLIFGQAQYDVQIN